MSCTHYAEMQLHAMILEIQNAAGRIYFTWLSCLVFLFLLPSIYASSLPKGNHKERKQWTSRVVGGEEGMGLPWWLTSCCPMLDWFWELVELPCWESLHWQWNGWVFLRLLRAQLGRSYSNVLGIWKKNIILSFSKEKLFFYIFICHRLTVPASSDLYMYIFLIQSINII